MKRLGRRLRIRSKASSLATKEVRLLVPTAPLIHAVARVVVVGISNSRRNEMNRGGVQSPPSIFLGGIIMNEPVFSLQWHITTSCDQRCRHCYIYNSASAKLEIEGESRMDRTRLYAIADDLVISSQRLGSRPRVSLTGGNPLLHPDFWALLSYLGEKKVRVNIMGNPFGLTDVALRRLKESGVTTFQLSLDGMEKTHDSFRSEGSFRATVEAIAKLQRSGIRAVVMSTVSKGNADDLLRLIDFVAEIGVDAFSFARYCPTHGDIDESFSPVEYRAFLEKVWASYNRLSSGKTEFILKDHLWTLFLWEKGLFSPQPTDGIIVSGCGVGVSHLTVLADGSVYACRRFRSPLGRVPEQSLYDIFLGGNMEEYRNFSSMEKCNNCQLLSYCRGCMAVSYGVMGRWTAADPQCWK